MIEILWLTENYFTILYLYRIYILLKNFGENYSWYSTKQIALIDIENLKVEEAIGSLEKSYLNLNSPNVYQTYDFAQFLKNNEKFEKAYSFYSNVLKNISQ